METIHVCANGVEHQGVATGPANKEKEEYKQLNLLHNYKKRKEKEMTKNLK